MGEDVKMQALSPTEKGWKTDILLFDTKKDQTKTNFIKLYLILYLASQ